MCLIGPVIVQATETAPLECVEIGWVVENNTKFGLRNQCDQRIYLKIFENDVVVSQDFLDKNQWFPARMNAKLELFANAETYQNGPAERSVELNQDVYCQTRPETLAVAACADYVAPSVEVSEPIEPTPTPEVVPSVSGSESVPEVSTSTPFVLDDSLVVAGAIFVGVIVGATLILFIGKKIFQPKSIYIKSNQRRKYRRK